MTTSKTESAVIAAPTMTAAQLDAAIAGVQDESKTLQQRIHDVAVEIMLHCFKHNDFSRAQVLVDGLGDGMRKKGLVGWFNKVGLDVNQENGCFNGFKREIMKRNWAEYLTKGWWTCNPEKPFKLWDFDAELARLVKMAEKRMTEEAAARKKFDMDESEDKGEFSALTANLTAERLNALKQLAVRH